MSRRRDAFIAIEVALALLLLSPILIGVIAYLHQEILTNIRIKQERLDTNAFLRSTTLLKQVIADLDSHRFMLFPRVHKNGAIAFTDGTPNPIMEGRTTAPSPDSDAITGLKIEVLNTYIVKNISTSAPYLIIYACARYPTMESLSPDSYRSFIGVSVDEIRELRGTVTKDGARKGCATFTVIPTKSMTAASTHLETARNIRLIIPIAAHYTLYVDGLQQLRYLSHAGELNIENQPVSKNVAALLLSLDPVVGQSLSLLSVKISFSDGRTQDFSAINSLGRLNYLNFVMNRP